MSTLDGGNRIGFGTWKLPADHSTSDLIYNIIRCGYRHIDCASVYGNEAYVGNGIKKALDDGIVTRKDLWITSKLWNTYHASEHVEPALKRTLKDLQLDYIDLYLIHFPIPLKYVPPNINPNPGFLNAAGDKTETENIPLSETWGAMEELVNNKLTRYIGVSNFDLQLLQDLLTYCKIRPWVLQIEMHLFLQQRVLVEWCSMQKIYVSAYSPLGSESYTSQSSNQKDEFTVLTHPLVLNAAKQLGKTAGQIALRWLTQQSPWVQAIVKTRHLNRAKENLDSLTFLIPDDLLEQLNALSYRRRYNDTTFYTKTTGWVPIFCD